jgi:YD repeat-containing protein
VTYTYNDIGQVLTRVEESGTTAYGYDQMGR